MKPSIMSEQELSAKVSLGASVADFMRSNHIYREVILPGIKRAKDEASEDGDWQPGKVTDTDTIAIYNAFNSGRKSEQGFVVSLLERVVADGQEAAKELERRAKNAVKK